MAKRFKPGQTVWYFDYLGTVAFEGPQARVFHHYRNERSRAVTSSPHGHKVEVAASNVYASAEEARAGEAAKKLADQTIERLAAEDLILEQILAEALAR